MKNQTIQKNGFFRDGSTHKKHRRISVASLLLIAVTYGCGTKDDNKTTNTPTSTLQYADVKTAIDAKCVTCHTSGAQSPALDTLASIKTHKTKALSLVQSGSMPPSYGTALTADEKTKLVNWLGSGSDLQ